MEPTWNPANSSALFRLSRTSLGSAPEFSATQSLIDSGVTHFLEESAHFSTFASILAGGGASRLTRTGILALGANATGRTAVVFQGLAGLGSLGAEVMAFEGTARGLTTLQGGSLRNPNLWRWNGEGGLRQGLFTSGINFTAFRGAGSLSQGQNIVFQHAAQSTAMVLGHNVAGAFHLIHAPDEPLSLQFLSAEQMNLSLSAGMGALHTVAPGLHAFERSLDLANQARREIRPPEREGTELGRPLAVETNGVSPRSRFNFFSFLSPSRKNPNVMEMSIRRPGDPNGEGEGGSGAEAPLVIESGRRRRGDETREVRTCPQWDPYRIEGIPRGTRYVQLSPTSEPVRDVLHTVQQEITKDEPRSLVIGIEGGLDPAVRLRLTVELLNVLRESHQQRPFPENLVIAVGIPAQGTAFLFRPHGREIRKERVELDVQGGVALRGDDTPDLEVEAAAAQARQSLPPGTPVATTVMQIFDRLTEQLSRGDAEVLYPSRVFDETELAGNIARWLGRGKVQLQRDRTATLLIPANGSRLVFSRGTDRVTWESQPMEGAAQPSSPRTPPPSTPVPPSTPRIPEGPVTPRREDVSSAPSTAEARRDGVNPPSEPAPPEIKSAPPSAPSSERSSSSMPSKLRPSVEVVSNPLTISSRVAAMATAAEGANMDLIYTGGRRLSGEEIDRVLSQVQPHLNGEQRFRILLTQHREILEYHRRGDRMVSTEGKEVEWAPEPAFESNTVRSWGKLIQNLSYFLHPYATGAPRNPVITYTGKDWSDSVSLQIMAEVLGDHPLSMDQKITFRVGRQNRLMIERVGDRVNARIEAPGETPRDYSLWPDPTMRRWWIQEGDGGASYAHQSLEAYFGEAAGLVKVNLGVPAIGRAIERRINTGLPVETVIQSPQIRGQLLAEIANGAIENHQLPNFLNQWVTVHRFIEKAYAHLDFETVRSYRKHLVSITPYEEVIQAFNQRVPPSEQLIPLDRMATELPETYAIPRHEELREDLLRQIFTSSPRSPRESLVLIQDPRRLGSAFAAMFGNRMRDLAGRIEGISEILPGEDINGLFALGRSDLSAEGVRLREALRQEMEYLREYRRIFTEGRGQFHETFLRSFLYASPTGLRGSYPGIHQALSAMTPELLRNLGIVSLPSLEDLESQIPPEDRRDP